MFFENVKMATARVQVILEDAFFGHQGFDLFDLESAAFVEFRIRRACTLREFLASLAEDMRTPVERLRPWPLTYRTNQTLRPAMVELEDGERSMTEVLEQKVYAQSFFLGAEIQPKHLVFCYLGFLPGFSLVFCCLPHPMHSRF